MVHPSIERRTHPPGAVLSDWKAPDGWIHRKMELLQAQPRSSRGRLLFVGGRGDFIEKYIEAVVHWHSGGWDVTTFDWRGQGASRGPAGEGAMKGIARFHPLDDLVTDLAAFIDGWRGSSILPHALIAHSMGGHIALRALVQHHPKIDAAVLVAPMLMINSGSLGAATAARIARLMCAVGLAGRPAWSEAMDRSSAGPLRQSRLTSSLARYEDELWWRRQNSGFNLGAPTWAWLRDAYESMARLDAMPLHEISTPILFLGAAKDRIVDPQAIRRAAGRVPAAELEMFDDAAHEILREEDPVREKALTLIDRFLDQACAA